MLGRLLPRPADWPLSFSAAARAATSRRRRSCSALSSGAPRLDTYSHMPTTRLTIITAAGKNSKSSTTAGRQVDQLYAAAGSRGDDPRAHTLAREPASVSVTPSIAACSGSRPIFMATIATAPEATRWNPAIRPFDRQRHQTLATFTATTANRTAWSQGEYGIENTLEMPSAHI